MSTDKQMEDEDNETVMSSTEKTDEQEDAKSQSSNSDNDDTDSNASSEYEVEKILAKRRRRRGGYEYYIKWVGYDKSANEWIPEESLNCPERVAEFHRKEAQKQERFRKNKDKNSSSRGRKSKNHRPVSKRRVKVIHDDDDDDDDDEQEVITKPTPSSASSAIRSEKESRRSSITYGVEKGYTVQAILGINRTKSDQLHYLVHYNSPTDFEDNMELIPSNVAKKFCEDEVIQFYETRIVWNDRPND